MARKSQRVAKPKSPVSGPQVSRAQKKFELGKTIHKEAKSVQSQIGEETEKAYKRSMWSSVGAALGSLALGIATGGSTALIHGVAVAVGATGFGYAGKELAERSGAKRKDVKSDLFYEKEAGAQTLAFKDFDKELSTSIWQKGVMSGLLAGGVKWGGDLYKEKQLAKLGTIETDPVGGEILADVNIGETSVTEVDEIHIGTETGIKPSTTKGRFNTESMSEELLADVMEEQSGTYGTEVKTAGLETITPASDEIAKGLKDTLATAFEAGLSGKDIAKTQQSILLGGGYALSSYRPELSKLRPVQFATPRGLSYS